MTGVLVVLAVLSAIGGFVACRTSSSRCCRCRRCAEQLHHFETPLARRLGRARARRPRRRRVPVRRRRRARRAAARALRRRCTACSSGKYFVDEALRPPASARPLVLDLGPRLPAPRRPRAARRLAATASRALAQRTRGRARPRADRQPAALRAGSCSSASIACARAGACAMADAGAAQRRPVPAAGRRSALLLVVPRGRNDALARGCRSP